MTGKEYLLTEHLLGANVTLTIILEGRQHWATSTGEKVEAPRCEMMCPTVCGRTGIPTQVFGLEKSKPGFSSPKGSLTDAQRWTTWALGPLTHLHSCPMSFDGSSGEAAGL